MRARRRLVLRKEALTELLTDELTHVVGADAATVPLGACVEAVTSKVVECDSYLRPCITHTCTR